RSFLVNPVLTFRSCSRVSPSPLPWTSGVVERPAALPLLRVSLPTSLLLGDFPVAGPADPPRAVGRALAELAFAGAFPALREAPAAALDDRPVILAPVFPAGRLFFFAAAAWLALLLLLVDALRANACLHPGRRN